MGPMMENLPSDDPDRLRMLLTVKRGESALQSAEVARELLRYIMLPEDVDAKRNQPFQEMVDDMYPTLLELVMNTFVVQELFQKFTRIGRVNDQKVKAATDEKLATEEKLKAAEAEIANSREEQAKLRAEADASRAQCTDLEARLKKKDGVLSGMTETIAVERSRCDEARVEAADLRAAINRCSERAEKAERALAVAGPSAVAEYKESEDFANEVSEAATGNYLLGFADCKRVVAKFFADLDLTKVVIDEVDEEAEDGAGAETSTAAAAVGAEAVGAEATETETAGAEAAGAGAVGAGAAGAEAADAEVIVVEVPEEASNQAE